MATIKPIEDRTVHQIQSGQVIVDLCSVVKELVENSLDAGATTIGKCSCLGDYIVNNVTDWWASDVRFKSQGLGSIEVQDNGDGIASNNYETIALKHYTSKLSTYSDLTTLQTFGFRGEALSSLCALSRFSIITCVAADAPKGTKLDFEISGKLKGTGVVAAQKGTTVTVENLFNNLPVRRRELERNIKREWNRVVGVLGQYACIQAGIKFSVSQQPPKGKKTTLFSTKGSQTTRENIVNVFGAKTLAALITLDLHLKLEATSAPTQRWSTQDDGGNKDVRVVGHISRPAFGEGRQTPDRQMFFVNARPCGLPQVAKAFNEVYKSYNGTQSPFIFANIELDTHLYDVNVSPDKRTILLHDQSRMLENLKTALTELFESQDYTVPISQLPAQKQPSYRQLTFGRENTRESTIRAETPKAKPTPNESAGGEDSEDDSRSSSRAHSMDEERPRKPYDSASRGAVRVSRDSMNRDGEAVSLISNWIGRKAEDRSAPKDQPPKAANEGGEGLSREKKLLIENLRREIEHPVDPDDDSQEQGSPVSNAQWTNATLSNRRPEAPVRDHSVDRECSREASQPPIPVTQSPSKLSSTVLNTFSSSRPRRASPAIATISIGDDHTVTSSIGAPCPKKPRFSNGPTSTHNALAEAPSQPLPSFGNKLNQRFSAPGATQRCLTIPNEDSEEENPKHHHHASPCLSERLTQVREIGGGELEVAKPKRIMAVSQPEEGDESLLNLDVSDDDGEYIDEDEKRAREEARVQEMIKAAEDSAAQPSQETIFRAKSLLKGSSKKRDSTLNLVQGLKTIVSSIRSHIFILEETLTAYKQSPPVNNEGETLDSDKAEEKLSLTISKADFANMKVIGQFNVGFILASRSKEPESDGTAGAEDELFIIDQHASDEKYNFERLQAITVVQSQPLVNPKTLDLTAMEEEIVMENLTALEKNGFIVAVDQTGEVPVGQRCQLISLPVSRETTFSITDLEELLALLVDTPPGSLPRPSKVRKMFAMRACRSSIMIGRTLTHRQMGKIVKHLGELDKPWNCPHGRPTMRHLCGLGVWDELGWKEGSNPFDDEEGPDLRTDWAGYVKQKRGNFRVSIP